MGSFDFVYWTMFEHQTLCFHLLKKYIFHILPFQVKCWIILWWCSDTMFCRHSIWICQPFAWSWWTWKQGKAFLHFLLMCKFVFSWVLLCPSSVKAANSIVGPHIDFQFTNCYCIMLTGINSNSLWVYDYHVIAED